MWKFLGSKKLVEFIKRWTLAWYGVTVLVYIALIIATVFLFPATTLTLSIFVLFAGFTAALASLASAVVQADEAKEAKEERQKKQASAD